MPNRVIQFSLSIRMKLLLLTLAVFLPAAGIIVASGLERRGHEISTAESNALLLVQSLAAQQEQIAIGTKQMLSTLAQLPEVQRLDVQACSKIFRDLVKRVPFYSTIGLASPDGSILASALPLSPGSVNIAEQKHIKDVKRTLDFSVGEYIIGKVSNIHTIHYSYPVLDNDQNLKAIVIAGFNLDDYAPFIRKANLPEDSAVIITDHRGVRLYRLPENDSAAVGTFIRKETIKQLSGGQDKGLFKRTGDDGISRVYAFQRLRLREDLPPYVYMIVGIAKDKILYEANLNLLHDLSLLGLATLIVLSFAWFFSRTAFIRPVSQLVAATQQLSSGELGARTGLLHTRDELGHLAKSFDDMASLLEQKHREQQEVERSLRESELFSRSTLDALSAHIAILDEEGFILCTNRSWDAFGKSNQIVGHEFQGMNYLSVCERSRGEWAEEALVAAAGIREVISGEKDGFELEYPCHSPDEKRWFNMRVTRFKDHEPARVVVAHENITDRKKAEEALRESEQRFRLALHNAPVSVAVQDLELRYIWAYNQRTARPEEIIGRFDSQIFTAEEAAHVSAIKRRVIEENVEINEQMWLDRPSGRIFLDVYFSPTRNELGRVTGVGIATVDLTPIKVAEEALRESEEKYRSLFNNMNEIMAIDELLCDEEGNPSDWRILDVNPAYLLSSGKSRDDIVGRSLCDIYGLAHAPGFFLTQLAQVVKTGKPVRFEQYFEPLRIHALVSAFPLGGARLATLITDITDRKQAEERFALAFANNPAAIAMTRLEDGLLTDVNDTWVGLTGYTREEAIGHSAREMQIWPTTEASSRFVQELRATGSLHGWEQEFLTKSGETYVAQLSAQVLAVRGERVILSTLVDITERKRMEEALRESEGKFRSLAESSTDCIMRYDRDGRHLYVNAACARIAGIPVEAFIGKTHRELGFEKRHCDEWEEKIRGVFDAGLPEHWDFEFQGAEGPVYLDWRAVPEFKEGNVVAVLGISRDITARVNAERELRFLSSRLLSAQEEERKRIAGELHDGFGASLSAVKISLENARRRLEDGDAAADLLEIPIAWTQYLMEEARRLMRELRPSVLDDMGVTAALAWLLKEFRTTYPGIHVSEDIGIEEAEVPEPLKTPIFRVTQEAFHNIAKYSRAEYASLSLVRSNGEVRLSIEDRGVGFDLESTLSESSEKRGLGLTSMKERVELSGGTFHLLSEVGRGTVIEASWSIGSPSAVLFPPEIGS